MEARQWDEVISPIDGTAAAVLPSPVGAPAVRPLIVGRIPRFPLFKPLELTDQLAVESWARRFPPYSDFNFVSLWTWNTGGNIELSWLNDNLVVKFKDYLSPARFYSFLGTTDVVATTLTLLDAARQSGIDNRLQLIPEFVVAQTPELRSRARLAMDRPQFDYVLSTDQWATLAGGDFRKKRNVVHQLERTRAPHFRPIDAGQTETQRAIQEVFGRWTVQRGCAGQPDTIIQSLALKRVFSLDRPGDLLCYGVFIDGELRAYSINEAVPGGYALGHFWRADRTIPGLYPYLLHMTSRALHAAGCHYLNTFQDVGVPGLANAKTLERPHHYLRKYIIAAVDDTSLIEDGHPARPASSSAGTHLHQTPVPRLPPDSDAGVHRDDQRPRHGDR